MKYRRRTRSIKNKLNIRLILIVSLCLLVVVAGILLITTIANRETTKEVEEVINIDDVDLQEIEDEEEEIEIEVEDLDTINALISERDRKAIELYDSYFSCNTSAFKGIVQFESGLVDQPFVQGPDNDMYLRRDWKTGAYSVMGSVFMDYECTLDSQNIIIYGHNAFSSYYAGKDSNGNDLVNDNLGFTSLKYLTQKSNYENNKYVDLILMNEVRQYQIVSVYYCPLSGSGDELYPDEKLQYYLPEYSDSYFKTYKNRIEEVEFYDTGVSYSNGEKFLTLQTCVEGNDMVREIVLCKQVGSRTLDRNAYQDYTTRLEKRNSTLRQAGINPDEYNQK